MPTAVVLVLMHKEGAVVFIIFPVAEVAIPCRIVVVSIAGEFFIVDGGRGVSGRRCIVRIGCVSRGRSVSRIGIIVRIGSGCAFGRGGVYWCRSDISATVDNSSAIIRPVIVSRMTKTNADIDLGIAFGSDKAGGYDGGKDE